MSGPDIVTANWLWEKQARQQQRARTLEAVAEVGFTDTMKWHWLLTPGIPALGIPPKGDMTVVRFVSQQKSPPMKVVMATLSQPTLDLSSAADKMAHCFEKTASGVAAETRVALRDLLVARRDLALDDFENIVVYSARAHIALFRVHNRSASSGKSMRLNVPEYMRAVSLLG